MTRPSTLMSRNLTVAETTVVPEVWIRGGPDLPAKRFTVDPPFTCFPGRLYRAELDDATRTATITEEVAS